MASVDMIPPKTVADQAALGLELRRKFKRGGTQIGVARARDLKNRKPIPPATIKRMVSYFARHTVDKKAGGFGDKANPSAGYIAWLLWGGEAGRRWAESKKKRLDAKVK